MRRTSCRTISIVEILRVTCNRCTIHAICRRIHTLTARCLTSLASIWKDVLVVTRRTSACNAWRSWRIVELCSSRTCCYRAITSRISLKTMAYPTHTVPFLTAHIHTSLTWNRAKRFKMRTSKIPYQSTKRLPDTSLRRKTSNRIRSNRESDTTNVTNIRIASTLQGSRRSCYRQSTIHTETTSRKYLMSELLVIERINRSWIYAIEVWSIHATTIGHHSVYILASSFWEEIGRTVWDVNLGYTVAECAERSAIITCFMNEIAT